LSYESSVDRQDVYNKEGALMIRTALITLLGLALLSGGVLAEDGGFGIGVIAGEPTGLSGEMWLTKSTAIDAAAAWSFGAGEDAFLIHSDYLFYNMGWIDVKTGTMAVYFGLGGRVKFATDTQVGIRIPVGLDYMFEGAPVDIFGEIVPILDLVDKTELNLAAALGVRYFFGRRSY
jgi:hypothetical protein